MDSENEQNETSSVAEMKCPACQGELEEGHFPASGYWTGLFWYEGEYPQSLLKKLFGTGRRKIRVTPWRCVDCGRLEFYARPENMK